MKLIRMVITSAILGIFCYAPNASGNPPTVSEILAWISSHFETVTKSQDDPNFRTTLTTTYSMSFKECEVTLTTTISSRTVISDPQAKNRGQVQSYSDVFTAGPFELSNLRPDKIVLGTDSPSMTISSVNPISYTRAHDGRNTPGDESESTTSDTRGWVGALFATQDMAVRQSKAWHDAIIACGGKPVSDHLY